MKNLISRVLIIISALAMYTFVSVVLSIPVLLLWNWLMPTIFGITKITLGQAWGISLLCGLLFGQSSSEKSN
jgi:hypothetical protein